MALNRYSPQFSARVLFCVWIVSVLVIGCAGPSPIPSTPPLTAAHASTLPSVTSAPGTELSPTVTSTGELSPTTVLLPDVTSTPAHGSSPTPLVGMTPTPTAVVTPHVTTATHVLAHLAAPGVNFISLMWHWRYASNLDWSPDGTTLVYRCKERGLCLARDPDFTARLLIQEASVSPQPRWSPDGQKIAFVYERPYSAGGKQTVATIAVIRTDGSGFRDLLPGDLAVTGTGAAAKTINRWLNDDSLSFMAHCGTECESLYKIEVAKGVLTPLVRWPDGILRTQEGINYHWSPDQKTIAMERRGRQPCLLLLDTAGGQETSLSPCMVQWFESWAPDSQRFLYGQWVEPYGTTLQDGKPVLHIWKMTTNEGLSLLPNALNAAWSPDGHLVAFELLGKPAYDQNGRITDTDFQPGQAFALHVGLMDVDTREVIALIPCGVSTASELKLDEHRPVWSPDGDQVAYRDSNGDLWVMRADGYMRWRLTWNLPAHRVIWSPDGSKLAFTTSDAVYVVERPSVQQAP